MRLLHLSRGDNSPGYFRRGVIILGYSHAP